MRVDRVLATAVIVLAGVICWPCLAENKPVPPAQPAPVAQPAAKPAPAKTVSQPKTSKPAAPAKAKRRRGTDLEITALTSEITDQLYSRLLYNQFSGPRKLFVRGGYSITKTRTFSKNKVNTSQLNNYTFDGQYRRDRKKTYNFFSAVANLRNRSPHSSTYADESGYYMFSAGVGRKLIAGLEGEVGLAFIHRLTEDVGSRIEAVYALRVRSPITDSMSLDGETHFVEPFANEPLVDSRTNLTYKFTPTLSLRLSYIANNLLPSPTSKSGWDKSFRISLVFSKLSN